MCEPISISAAMPYILGLGAASVVNQYQQGEDAKKAGEKASQQATAAATKTADQADQANNRANSKQPDLAGMASSNQLAAKGGISGTMLTGPQGVDPKTLLLGKSTLLGA